MKVVVFKDGWNVHPVVEDSLRFLALLETINARGGWWQEGMGSLDLS